MTEFIRKLRGSVESRAWSKAERGDSLPEEFGELRPLSEAKSEDVDDGLFIVFFVAFVVVGGGASKPSEEVAILPL